MTAMTDVAFDLIVAEQLSEVVPCEGDEEQGCALAAVWVYRHGCGEAWLLCTPHRVILDRRLRSGGWLCDRCNKPMPRRINWSQL